MMTIPISYSSVFDSAYYPMLCTSRLGPSLCPCTFNSSSYNNYSSSYSSNSAGCSPTYTPSSSPPFRPTPAAHQSGNLVSAMLSASPGSVSFSKFLFNPNASLFNQPFSQQYPVFNGISSALPSQAPYCNGTAKRFVFTPGSWKQS